MQVAFDRDGILAAMADQISPELFAHLVELAALELDAKEAEYLRRELNNQLKAIDELAAIPLDESTPITTHGVPYTAYTRPQFRKDDPHPSDAAAAIMNQAPEPEDGYLLVPEIPHEDLE